MKYLLGLVFGFLVVASIANADSVGMNNKTLTYELSARVFALGGQWTEPGTITGTFSFKPHDFLAATWSTPPDVDYNLRFNPPPSLGGPSVPLVMTEFSSRFPCGSAWGDASCVPTMYLVEPGVGFAYLEFVQPIGRPAGGALLQPVWNLRGAIGSDETEEFQLGGSIGYGEVAGSANLVTQHSANLMTQYSASLATPEPSTGLLLLVAVVFGLLLLRRPHP